MADPTGAPHARSPLAGRVEVLAAIGAPHGEAAVVAASEVAFLAQVNLRLDVRLAGAVPLALPSAPNTWVASDAQEALWLGPDEWLIVGEPGGAPGIVQAVGRALGGVHHSVVDVSASRAVIELTGDSRLDLLAQGCGLDLHPRAWRAGRCAQTLLAQIPVLLQERDGATRVFFRPSYSGHLVSWLRRVGQPAG